MNNKYYTQNSGYPNNPLYVGGTASPTPIMEPNPNYQPMALPAEQSYIENILRLNKGKKVRVHQTFPDSNEWRDLEFQGIIEQSGRDHIILSDPSTGVWQVLLMIYVDYISFDEPINYSAEFYPSTN